jgi:uncharacterized iron-regulated membrane protein
MSKQLLYKWHKRLGLTVGFILLILGVSGTILTYRDELMPKLYSELMLVHPQSARMNLETQIRSAKSYLKDQDMTHLYTSERDDTASMIFFRPEGALLPHLISIDPYTAVVKGEMPLIKNVFGVMLYLHANLLLGKTGSWIVGTMGFLLCLFFVTGVIIWWPQTDFITKLKTLPKSGVRGIHRGLGLFLGLPLLFTGITGCILAFDLAQPLGRFLGDKAKPAELTLIQPCVFEEQIKALSHLSEQQASHLVSIHFCSPKNGLMKFSYGFHERSGHDGYVRIIVDPKTQKIVQKFDTSVDPQSWSANAISVYPMHTGAYFGGLGRILIFICGIALSLLFFTGITPTLRKFRRRHHV